MPFYQERHDQEIARVLNPDDGISLEAIDLLHRALDNPDAYRHDVEGWMASDDSICAAEGNLITGAVCRVDDPVRAVGYFEEARRLYIGRNYYPEAAKMAKILSLLFEHVGTMRPPTCTGRLQANTAQRVNQVRIRGSNCGSWTTITPEVRPRRGAGIET